MKRGKNYTARSEKIEKGKDYAVADAIALLKETSAATFDESIEVHMRLGIDVKKGEQAVRGSVTLPHGSGKSTRVGVITSTKEAEAKEAGADIIGGEELIKEIQGGKLPDVDVLVASPEMMPKLAPAAKVLGPKGLMPSPKTETVGEHIADIVGALKKGKESFKNDGGGNVHLAVGKLSTDADKLVENAQALIDAVKAAKNDAHKGQFIVGTYVCTTMSPSIKVKA